jgi:hypothetical protein
MPQCKFASMPQCIFASMPHCKFATMPQCKCAEQHTAPLTSTTCGTRSTMQIRYYATVQMCRTAHRPSHIYHVLYTLHNANLLYTLHNANSLLCHSARLQNSTPPLSPLPRAVHAPQCKFATMPQCKCAEQHTAPLTSTTCWTRSTMQIRYYATVQIRYSATVHVCRTAHRPSYLYHVLYTLHNANSLLCHSARVQNSTPPLSPLPRAVRAPQCSAQSPQRPL